MSDMYDKLKASPDLRNPGDSQIFVDLGYLCYNGESSQIKKSHFSSSYIVAASLNTNSSEVPLFLALQIRNNEPRVSLSLFIEA